VNATTQLDNFFEGAKNRNKSGLDIKYLRINVKDSEETKLTPFFEQVNNFIAKALAATDDTKGGSILVHCIAG
jgi:protein-tyrosine phosphatase